MNWKSILILILLVGSTILFILMRDSAPSPIGLKAFIIGIDGMDAGMTERLMRSGKLPHLSALAAAGTYSRLQSTNPAESPVAWASLMTGSNPGRTGLFGFLKRDTSTYQPQYAPTTFVQGTTLLNLFPLRHPQYIHHRSGIPFWDVLSRNGLRSAVLWCPETFPPDDLEGVMLSGMEVPDLQGSTGTFAFYTSDESLPAVDEVVIPLRFENGRAQTSVRGPSPWLQSDREPLRIPLMLELTEDRSALSLTVGSATQRLRAGTWSDWFEMTFPFSPFWSVKAIGRFYLQSIMPTVKLYLGPLNLDPRDPLVPISSPRDLSVELARAVGLFKTVGWESDTWGVTEGYLDERAFLADVYQTLHTQEAIVIHMVKQKKYDVLFAVFGGLDRVQHIFWRYLDDHHPFSSAKTPEDLRNAIENLYIETDRIVGNLLSHIDDQTVVLIVSDHGMAPFRRGLNLNTWLVKNGFMRLRSDADSLPAGTFFPNVDWSQTRAYAVGIGGIYLNVTGREAQGIVRNGDEFEKVREEIIHRLSGLTDEPTGRLIVHRVYKREDLYEGNHSGSAPDLVVGLIPGYRVSQLSSLGGFESTVVVDNLRPWSGDHVSVDPEFVPGVLFINRRIEFSSFPSIVDIAPTVVSLFGLPPSSVMDGRSILAMNISARK